MESANVFLLTGSYINIEKSVPEIRLFGRTSNGDSICLTTTDFHPYFYVRTKSSGVKFLLQLDERVTNIEEVELKVPKKGNPHLEPFLKITTRLPHDVPQIRRTLQDAGHEVYAADVLYHLRFLYDNGLGAFISVKGNYINDTDISVKGNYINDTDRVKTMVVEEWGTCEPFDPHLTYLSIDIENSMEREDKKIFCIGWSFKDGEITENGCIYGQEVEILQALVRLINEYDPDVITGYNINQYDLPHIARRAGSTDVSLSFGRDGTSPRPKYLGRAKRNDSGELADSDIERWLCNGRVVADAWKIARFTWHPKRETLRFVADSLGLAPKLDVDTAQIDDEWRRNRKKVREYCTHDAELALDILLESNMMFDARFMAEKAMLPLEFCILPKQSWLLDSLLIRRFDAQGWAVPCMQWGTKVESKIKGAHVVQPEAGVYDWVFLLDFKAMYPSIIISDNMCYTTHIKDDKFTSKRVGLVPELMGELQDERDQAKKEHKVTGETYWDRIQWALKILSNAVYGLFTSAFYRFTNRHIGESITAHARRNIRYVLEALESSGYRVLYGDTDSVFVQGKGVEEACRCEADDISRSLTDGSMILELEKVFERWFTHGKKKRYVGYIYWPDDLRGQRYTRGYEVRRGDTFTYQDSVLSELLNGIVGMGHDSDPEEACKGASRAVTDLLKGKVETEELIITKTVYPEDKYKNPDSMMGVRAARKLMAYGYRWIPGTKLSWVVTDGSKTPMVVEPWIPTRVEKPIPDLTYYARRVVDTVVDITAVFGYDRDGLYSGTKPTTLDRWCGNGV
jgi:DNA polymerase I